MLNIVNTIVKMIEQGRCIHIIRKIFCHKPHFEVILIQENKLRKIARHNFPSIGGIQFFAKNQLSNFDELGWRVWRQIDCQTGQANFVGSELDRRLDRIVEQWDGAGIHLQAFDAVKRAER